MTTWHIAGVKWCLLEMQNFNNWRTCSLTYFIVCGQLDPSIAGKLQGKCRIKGQWEESSVQPLRASRHLEMGGSSVDSHTEAFWKGQLQLHRMLPGERCIVLLAQTGGKYSGSLARKEFLFLSSRTNGKGRFLENEMTMDAHTSAFHTVLQSKRGARTSAFHSVLPTV